MKGLGALLLLISYDAVLALLPPTNVTISSRNFQHILTWDDPNNQSLTVYYSVEYWNGFRVKKSRSCLNITSRQCDLTKDFTDIMIGYTAMVRSFTQHEKSEVAHSKELFPIMNTLLGPAQVDVVPGDYCINVSVLAPVSHLWSEVEQRNVTMLSDDVYPLLDYHIYLEKTPQDIPIARDFNLDNTTTTIPQLLPNTNYCVSVSLHASQNLAPPIKSEPKCVITGPTPQSVGVTVIVLPVVFGLFLLCGIILVLAGLDRAGYLCTGRKFFPKVLRSFPQSESRFSGIGDRTPPPTYFDDVTIMEPRVEVEENKENESKSEKGGYENRKKLMDSGTSDEASSGPNTSVTSSSEASGQVSGSSGGHAVDIPSDSDGSGSSGTPLLTHIVDSPSDLQFNNSGVFNINLNSVSIANPVDAWTSLTPAGAEPDAERDSHPAGLSLNGDHFICPPSGLGVPELTAIDYCNSEDDLSDDCEDCDADEHPVSGYMSR